MISTVWSIGKDIKGFLDRPQLIVEDINVHDFKLLKSNNNFCRFVLLKVTNIGGRTANGCLSHLVKINDKEFKLHWSDESWDYRRNSAPKINLEPTESRDLDVVFTVYGNKFKPVTSVNSSDPIISGKTYDELSRLPGTLIPTAPMLGTTGTVTPVNTRFYIPESPRIGAWIASPSVPYDLSEECEEYLEPDRHPLEIRLIVSGAKGFVMNFDVYIGDNPTKLWVDKESVSYKL